MGWLQARHVDGHISRRRAEKAHEATIAKELVALCAALKLAVRAGLWLGNPAAVLPVRFAPDYRPREKFLTAQEASMLLGALLPDQAARVAFIVATGACWGESCRGERADVAQDLMTVFIRVTKRSRRLRTVPIVGETAGRWSPTPSSTRRARAATCSSRGATSGGTSTPLPPPSSSHRSWGTPTRGWSRGSTGGYPSKISGEGWLRRWAWTAALLQQPRRKPAALADSLYVSDSVPMRARASILVIRRSQKTPRPTPQLHTVFPRTKAVG